MDKNQLVGQLLRKERLTLGLTQEYVTRKVGFENRQTLISIENGKRPIRAVELATLAQVYGRSLDFFLKEEHGEEAPKVLWREPSKTKETLLAERKFTQLCQNYRRLLELTQEDHTANANFSLICSPNKQQFAQKSFDYVITLAEETRKRLDLGRRPAHSLADVLEATLGILVLCLDLSAAGSAASVSGEGCNAIVINCRDAPWRRNYDLAHELFHLITWDIFSENEIYAPPPKNSRKNTIEQWAEAFASSLLLPAEEARAEFNRRVVNRKIDYLSLVEIAREFRVSTEALLWRLANLHLMKRGDVESCLAEGEIKNVDKQMRITDWGDQQPNLSSRYIALAIKAYYMGKVSRAKLAEYVGTPLSAIPRFLREHGFGDERNYSIAFTAAYS
jgi:Zn-dependent peptidase ImmA (M78 family)/DNA-binding XRE family transcriptional regulator